MQYRLQQHVPDTNDHLIQQGYQKDLQAIGRSWVHRAFLMTAQTYPSCYQIAHVDLAAGTAGTQT